MPEVSGQKEFYHATATLNASGVIRLNELNYPAQHELGDAKHWPNGITTDWQMRPFEFTDIAPGIPVRPGDRLVGRRFPGVGRIMFQIHLPFHMRKNTRQNVALALKRIFLSNPEAAALLEIMAAPVETQAVSGKI